MMQDKAAGLKIKLKSATRIKLCKARAEYSLRNTERMLSEELQAINTESEMLRLQLEEVKSEISKIQCQIAMIGICEASEKSKLENHTSNLKTHKNGFEQLFSKENEALECFKMEAKKKEAAEQELERHKKKVKEEKTQLQLQEAQNIEDECDAIEQECVVLKKRNKAIMLKLRRKLIESEELRRELIKNNESLVPND